jgi:hypothetical protein
MYSGKNQLFGKVYKFLLNESDQRKNITGLDMANGPSLDQAEMQPII